MRLLWLFPLLTICCSALAENENSVEQFVCPSNQNASAELRQLALNGDANARVSLGCYYEHVASNILAFAYYLSASDHKFATEGMERLEPALTEKERLQASDLANKILSGSAAFYVDPCNWKNPPQHCL